MPAQSARAAAAARAAARERAFFSLACGHLAHPDDVAFSGFETRLLYWCDRCRDTFKRVKRTVDYCSLPEHPGCYRCTDDPRELF